MVSYKRKQGSKYQSKFCNRFLKPVFGQPDQFGNYTLIIGDKPTVSFMAHHDTVHRQDGKAKPDVLEDFVVSSTDDCLGAQHTKNEHQDWVFMLALADMLVAADWSKLVFERDPNVREYLSKYGNYSNQGSKANDTKDIDWSDLVDEIRHTRSNKHGANPLALEEIEDVVQRYPLQIARLLHDMGYTPDALMDDVGDYLSQRDYY